MHAVVVVTWEVADHLVVARLEVEDRVLGNGRLELAELAG